ncbi:MAG: flagellin [Pseudomonadota bacterium]
MTGQVLRTNSASLNAQRNLSGTNNMLQTNLQRLSSGFRINSAKDDAAGLQISNRLSSQINGLNQASRNANDGISLAQTAEGALQETTNLLQRIRDLAVQSANGSNSNIDRASLQREVSQLQAEMNRIAETTSFGGQNLLDGTFGSQSFQVGSNSNETISVSLSSSKATNLGRNSFDFNGTAFGNVHSAAANSAAVSNTVVADAFTLTGQLGTVTVNIAANDSAETIAATVNTLSEDSGITADARTIARLSGFEAGSTISFELIGDNTADSVSITSNIVDTTDLASLADAINQESGRTGVIAVANDTSIDLISETGDDIIIEDFTSSGTTGTITVGSRNYNNDGAGTGTATSVTIGASAGVDTTLVSGNVRLDGNGEGFTYAGAVTEVASATSGGSSLESVANIDISDFNGAQDAITVIDGAIGKIDGLRAGLGAVQNRFESTISNLTNISENVSAARSRIRDTDYATETSELAKSQVLQQAGLSVLSQANATSQSVLALLQ